MMLTFLIVFVCTLYGVAMGMGIVYYTLEAIEKHKQPKPDALVVKQGLYPGRQFESNVVIIKKRRIPHKKS